MMLGARKNNKIHHEAQKPVLKKHDSPALTSPGSDFQRSMCSTTNPLLASITCVVLPAAAQTRTCTAVSKLAEQRV
jgi:hypothetical protein